MTKTKTIDRRAKFDFVRYSNCWEDPLLLLGAMPERAKWSIPFTTTNLV